MQPSELDVDADAFAAWLEAQGGDRLWTVDGDVGLAGRLILPCPGPDLAAELRRRSDSRLRIFAPSGTTRNGQGIEAYADDSTGSPIFEVAWILDGRAGVRWVIAEDALAEQAVRAVVGHG